MREAMYGWMTRWLKNEGAGQPIPEPAHEVEKPEDLRCWPDDARPKGFLFPPSLAAREGRALVNKLNEKKWDHVEDWESHAVYARSQLRKQIFGDFPKRPKIDAKLFETALADGVRTTPVLLHPEPDLPLPMLFRTLAKVDQPQPACILLHMDGKAEALKHPLADAFLKKGWAILAPDLRGTGETKPASAAIRGAPDHHIAEHALWIGRPLLGQWVFDVQVALDWLGLQPGLDRRRFFVAGLGQAGLVALCAGGIFDDQVAGVVTLGSPITLVTEEEYGSGTYMGLLAPGILRVSDVTHLAALVAPRRLIVVEGVTPQGQKLAEKPLQEAFGFSKSVYALYKAAGRLTVSESVKLADLVEDL
jgi:pimeloyl-ACP methyl ester carboxylesterase